MNHRKIVQWGVIVICFLILSGFSDTKFVGASSDITSKQDILKKAFVEGKHSISIMEVALPSDEVARLNEISTRFKSNIEKNQQWFNDYISKHSNIGDNLPWNKKFGISKEEYDEMIFSVEKMRLLEKKKITISIVKENDGKFRIESNKDIPYLSGMKINITDNCVITDNGVFKYGNKIVASDDQKVTGRWNGGLWKLSFEEPKDMNSIDKNKMYGSINIAVGQLEKTNKIMVYYKERVISKGQSYKGEEIIVFNN